VLAVFPAISDISVTFRFGWHRSRSQNAVIRVYDDAGNVIERTSTRVSSKNRSGRFSGSNGFRFLNAE
jgi:YD repeat-containing protein